MPRNNFAETVDPIERNATASLVGTIVDRLEGMIIGGQIASGEKLNEYVLAQQLQVSRTALREAVRLLEHSGLVTILQNRGVFVRKVNLGEALDLFDVRAGLAYSAGRLAAVRATDAQIDELRRLHEGMVEACRTRDISAYYELNLQFHSTIMTSSGNERLKCLYEMMSNELHLFRRRNLGQFAQLEMSIREHGKIVDAIAAHDPRKAARAFEQHVLDGKQRMLDTLSPSSAS